MGKAIVNGICEIIKCLSDLVRYLLVVCLVLILVILSLLIYIFSGIFNHSKEFHNLLYDLIKLLVPTLSDMEKKE